MVACSKVVAIGLREKEAGLRWACGVETRQNVGRAWWLTSIIPALWEAEVGGSRGQEIETILVNKVKPRLY